MEKWLIKQEIFQRVQAEGFIIHWKSDLFDPKYRDAFWTLAGELSNVSESSHCYHTVYLLRKNPRGKPEYDTLSFLIKKVLQVEQQKNLYDQICAMLKNNAMDASVVIEDLFNAGAIRAIPDDTENAHPETKIP